MERLQRALARIDGRGYKAYKDITGRYQLARFELIIDHVQGDPFAAPSRLRAVVPWAETGLGDHVRVSTARQRAARDLLARAFRRAARQERAIGIDAGDQTVLDRSACLFTERGVELRFTVSLPARGRRILGRVASTILTQTLPEVVTDAVTADRLDTAALRRQCDVVEDQVALRDQLAGAGLVAFVGEGAVLPRRSGIDDRPLADGVPVEVPESLRVVLEAPNAGEVVGMGIPAGVTVIVGGGFHGKSTVLRALESGVWDHVPGDGREQVVTDRSAVKIRAEDGRSVVAVDLSPFINDLPYGRSTARFTSELASGSTSQAAGLLEALETGARVLLVDEDTSATNFMIRDRRMQELVRSTSEPITPFVDRIGELRDRLGVSTVLVMGGSGDYFDHADTVVQMDAYQPVDVTARARQIAAEHRTGRAAEVVAPLTAPAPRTVVPGSIRPERKPGRVKVQARDGDTLVLGRSDIDLRAVEQVTDPSQVRAIGWLLVQLSRERGSSLEPSARVAHWLERLEAGEWDWLAGRPGGDLAAPRVADVMAALNRLRGARFLRTGS
jgi:predicted ABC-class ATPase